MFSVFINFARNMYINRIIMKNFILTLTLLMVSTMAMAKVKTVVLTTNPQMHCVNCENRVKNNLKNVPGIKSVETSVADQTVTIKYNSKKTSEDALIKAFEGFGFKARRLVQGEKIVKEAHECKEGNGGGCDE